MTVLDDTLKGTTMGDPDGPTRFEETLDCEVPTFSDPRLDLVVAVGRGSKTTHKRLDYHVPFAYRGDFRPEQWPKIFREKRKGQTRVTLDGFVLCSGVAKRTGKVCENKAVNRSIFCRNHGGALHPADKKLSGLTMAPMAEDRIERLDRTQKFMQGFLSAEELDDDEITGSFVRNSHGVPVKSHVLGKKFEQIISKELHARLNRYLISKTPRALEVLYEILDSDLVEPADRLKAVQMLTDRTMGKPADILITHGVEEKPYESIIQSVMGGSREEYRKNVASVRLAIESQYSESENYIIDADEVEPESDESGSEEPESDGSESDGSESEILVDDESVKSIDLNENDGPQKYDASFLAEAERKKQENIETRQRIKKARARRYARRAIGGINGSEDVGFLLEYVVIKNLSSSDFGKYRMKVHFPHKITEALVARVRVSNSRDLLDVYSTGVEVGSKS